MRRVFHLSDVHFGPFHEPAAAEAALALVERRRPDLVVLSGDLTQRAKPRQFAEARRFVDRLAAPSLVVPGNHDVPLYRIWERLLAPFSAWRRHYGGELEPTFEDAELAVVGVNTAHAWTTKHGRISRARLARLVAQLARAPESRCRIVVAHHELVPAPLAASRAVLRNAAAAVRCFAAAGVELVLSGHLHQAFTASSDESYPTAGERFLIVHSGTSSSRRGRGDEKGRMTSNWLEIDERTIRVEALEWERGSGELASRSVRTVARRPPGPRPGL